MTLRTRFALAAAVTAVALLTAGCASTSESSPASPSPGSSSPTSPTTSGAPSSPGTTAAPRGDIEAAWLDGGRMFAVVTRGSSTCIPTVESVSANGQTLSVEVVDPGGDVACTDDLATRASLAAVPEGVDPTQEVELLVTYGDQRDDVELDGDPALTATPGSETDYQPSAGWFDDGGLVLLTWGSSGCPPVVESVHADGEDRGTVTFATDEDKVCTLDMAPRATLLSFDDDVEDDDFELTLQGGGLDAVVTVIG